MPTFKPMQCVVVSVAVLGVVLGAQFAQAGEKPQKTQEQDSAVAGKRAAPTTTSKVKVGDACKTNADCDPSNTDMICGKAKCEYDASKNHPAT